MATTKTTKAVEATEAVKQITYLASALKAPRILEAASRLADQARNAGWTHEDYLAAVLEREVSARNASGAHLRIRAAGFPGVKTLEDFDFDDQPGIRQQVAALASGGFLTEARNVVLLGPPGTGKTHLATAFGVAAARAGHRVLLATATDWVTRLTDAHRTGKLPNAASSWPRCCGRATPARTPRPITSACSTKRWRRSRTTTGTATRSWCASTRRARPRPPSRTSRPCASTAWTPSSRSGGAPTGCTSSSTRRRAERGPRRSTPAATPTCRRRSPS